MAGETTITVIGNATDEPALSFVANGTAMVKFTIASTPRTMDRQSGEWKDGDPLFLNCTAFRDLAEHIAESLSKGSRVIVQGRLQLSRWEDKETGEKRSAYGLVVDEIGASLRFATVKIAKMTRSRGDGFVPDRAPDNVFDLPASASTTVAVG